MIHLYYSYIILCSFWAAFTMLKEKTLNNPKKAYIVYGYNFLFMPAAVALVVIRRFVYGAKKPFPKIEEEK